GLFGGDVENPVEGGEILNGNWSYEQRRATVGMASRLLDELSSVIDGCYLPEVAVKRMRTIFGDRIPNRPDLVGVHLAAAAAVVAGPAAIVPAPVVGRSTSG